MDTTLKTILINLILISQTILIGNANAKTEGIELSKVMLFGVFHFANPGQDAVKTDVINVMTKSNQSYLAKLSKRISDFRPTDILLECDPVKTAKFQSEYQRYLSNNFELSANENYQLGFRIAKHSRLKEVSCYDERNVSWNAEPLFKYMPQHEQKFQKTFESMVSAYSEQDKTNHKTLPLNELLRLNNSRELDLLNKSFYILTNEVGAGDNFVGADAAASWWHRNFRMYANIQKVAKPGARVLVIGGQGHTAVLRDLLEIDQQRTLIDVVPYL